MVYGCSNMSKHEQSDDRLKIGRHAARYRWLRFQAGDMSQTEFGESIGVSRQHVSRCETGKAEYTHSELERIGQLLHMPMAWIMEPDSEQIGVRLAPWLPRYFRLSKTARRLFDTVATAALDLASWKS